MPTKKGYCRLCWLQASLEAKTNGEIVVLAPYLARLQCQQLFLARMHRIRQPGPLLGKAGRRKLRQPIPPEPARPLSSWIQPSLLDVPRDYRRFDRRRDQDLDNPWLVRARRVARELGAARGWTHWTLREVDRALVIALSGFTTGDTVRYCELLPALRQRGLNTRRTSEVLDQLGLFEDDRPTHTRWLDRKLEGVGPGIRHDVEDWVRTLRDGGPRSRPRDQHTVWSYLGAVQPLLLDWSNRYHHLREVTREDVRAVAASLQDSEHHHTLSALRSLFGHCKATGSLFRDPTARIRRGRRNYRVILPLETEEIHQAVAAAVTPTARVIILLAAVHAAQSKTIARLRLDDIDLGECRLSLAGHARPLDDLTRQAITDWLTYRRQRWPNTANPHLLVNRQTALGTEPVSRLWLTNPVRHQAATLERLRVDRQLEEALTHGPDPLHLAEVFGIAEMTAIRYATSARQILESSAEAEPMSSSSTHGLTTDQHTDGPTGSR
ncbi:hypothetical protein [Streptomyces mirabilis]|uniref:hypothetical protein n=1 Tax=Streptomyces mirabilis TaxID=68239 RepID=UPI0033BEB0BA